MESTAQWPDWIKWDEITKPDTIIKCNVNSTIGGSQGVYYGQCQNDGELISPEGCGALVCEDKLILGHTEKGEWAAGSPQCVAFRKKNQFLVYRLERQEDGSTL